MQRVIPVVRVILQEFLDLFRPMKRTWLPFHVHRHANSALAKYFLGILLGYPPHSALPDHLYRFDSLQGPPCRSERAVTFRQPSRFFTVWWSCSTTLLKYLH